MRNKAIKAYTMSWWSDRKQSIKIAQLAKSQGVKSPWSANNCAKACADARSQGTKKVAESLDGSIILILFWF